MGSSSLIINCRVSATITCELNKKSFDDLTYDQSTHKTVKEVESRKERGYVCSIAKMFILGPTFKIINGVIKH